jgi:hypothetical protein
MIEEEPSAQPALRKTAEAARPRRYVLGALLAAGLIGVGTVRWVAGFSDDRVAPEEVIRRQRMLGAAQPIPLEIIAPGQLAAAIDELNLPVNDREILSTDIAAGRVRMAWLSLYDSDAEDGDVVEIQSMGFTHLMLLTKKPKTIAIPVAASGSITLVGKDEGRGGGVTVGVMTRRGPLPLPPMPVGSTIRMSVVAG